MTAIDPLVRRSEPVTVPARVALHDWGWRHAGRRAFAVRHLDLVIEPGERVLLLGPSGAGKSTLLAGLAGLLEAPTSGDEEGQALIDGRPARLARDRVGLLLQDPESQLVMARAGDDVAFGLENRAVPRHEIWPRVDAALAAVGFPYGREQSTDALSGGEQQRLALAGVLVSVPGLLLLDEPTANLDPAGAALVRAVLAELLAPRDCTVVLVEHRVDEVVDLVDRVVVLDPAGGLLADGAPDAVFSAYGGALAGAGVWVPGHRPDVEPSTAPPAGPVLLTADALTVARPATRAPLLHGVSVSAAAGRALAVTGPNGAGKSTLARVLAGLVAPLRGGVMATADLGGPVGRPLHRWRARDLARRVGTVFQDPEHQFVTGRVTDELALGPQLAGRPPTEVSARVDRLADRLRLGHLLEANPFTLSGGEKRRLSVATALATDPRVLVLDEPTFGQDSRTWAELVRLLLALRDEGCALVAVTHDRALVRTLATTELVVSGGVVYA